MADPAADALARVFGPAAPGADLFTPAFQAAIPPDQVARLVASLIQAHGRFTGVSADAGGLMVHLAGADVPAEVAVDANGRITALRLHPPVPTGGPAGATLEDHLCAVAALPGQTSALVTTDGRRRGAHAADAALAVGSAFKLAVLRAAALAVEGGALAWDQVVPFDPAWRSLGSGIMQGWPDSTPVTLATLANLMVSLSDNTASDALLHLVGRAAVEAASPRNTPFLATREAFILKSDPALRSAWQAGGPAARRDLLAAIAGRALPTQATDQVTLGVEWFMTAAELAALLEATHRLPPVRHQRRLRAPRRVAARRLQGRLGTRRAEPVRPGRVRLRCPAHRRPDLERRRAT